MEIVLLPVESEYEDTGSDLSAYQGVAFVEEAIRGGCY